MRFSCITLSASHIEVGGDEESLCPFAEFA